jgi:hypothetical protein
MADMVHSGSRNDDRDAARPVLNGKLAAQGSDTDPPPVTKTAGLGEDQQGLAEVGSSDTDANDKTKAGLGED